MKSKDAFATAGRSNKDRLSIGVCVCVNAFHSENGPQCGFEIIFKIMCRNIF